jgi:hypothetical protein
MMECEAVEGKAVEEKLTGTLQRVSGDMEPTAFRSRL